MPRYKLHAASFINNAMHPAGAVIDYDGDPGTQLEPMDAEAWERHHAYANTRSRGRRGVEIKYPFKVVARAAVAAGPVEIPANWHGLKGLPLIHLARRLGAPIDTKATEARVFVEAEVAKRAQAPAEGT